MIKKQIAQFNCRLHDAFHVPYFHGNHDFWTCNYQLRCVDTIRIIWIWNENFKHLSLNYFQFTRTFIKEIDIWTSSICNHKLIIEYWWSLCKIVKIVGLLWKFIYNLKLYYRMLILIIKNKIGKVGFHKWSILKYSD